MGKSWRVNDSTGESWHANHGGQIITLIKMLKLKLKLILKLKCCGIIFRRDSSSGFYCLAIAFIPIDPIRRIHLLIIPIQNTYRWSQNFNISPFSFPRAETGIQMLHPMVILGNAPCNINQCPSYRSFSLSRNKKIYWKPSSGPSLRSLWPTVSELFAETFHAPL